MITDEELLELTNRAAAQWTLKNDAALTGALTPTVVHDLLNRVRPIPPPHHYDPTQSDLTKLILTSRLAGHDPQQEAAIILDWLREFELGIV